jgi:hypothetical protein
MVAEGLDPREPEKNQFRDPTALGQRQGKALHADKLAELRNQAGHRNHCCCRRVRLHELRLLPEQDV